MFKTPSKDYIYIYLHLPKTGGQTLRNHINKRFSRDSILEINFKELPDQEAAKSYLASLSDERKSQIRIIVGHAVFWGVHKYFKQKPRYITFVRNPVEQIVSLYNYRRTRFENKGELAEKICSPNGEIKTFASLIEEDPEYHNFTTRFLVKSLLSTDITPNNLLTKDISNDIKNILKDFYFIGIEDSTHSDEWFFYYHLGIYKFGEIYNISTKFYNPETQDEVDLIQSKSPYDHELFEFSKAHNVAFRKSHPTYSWAVFFMQGVHAINLLRIFCKMLLNKLIGLKK